MGEHLQDIVQVTHSIEAALDIVHDGLVEASIDDIETTQNAVTDLSRQMSRLTALVREIAQEAQK